MTGRDRRDNPRTGPRAGRDDRGGDGDRQSTDISVSLFEPSATLASVIANEFAEATSDLYVAALVELGLVLLILGIVLNVVARALVLGVQRRRYQERAK